MGQAIGARRELELPPHDFSGAVKAEEAVRFLRGVWKLNVPDMDQLNTGSLDVFDISRGPKDKEVVLPASASRSVVRMLYKGFSASDRPRERPYETHKLLVPPELVGDWQEAWQATYMETPASGSIGDRPGLIVVAAELGSVGLTCYQGEDDPMLRDPEAYEHGQLLLGAMMRNYVELVS